MPHNLVIGGQPDYLAYFYENLGFSWLIHGREITAGDAEKTLDRTPSVRYRAKSPMSGELYFKGQYGNFGGSPRDRSIAGIVHNLADIGARVRVIVGSTAQITNTFPTSTVEQDNTTSVFGDVDQETYGAMSTWAIPTVAATAWHLEVGFANATALQINVEDSQVILVRVRYRGTPGSGGVSLLIEAKEDDGLGTPDDFPVRASKELSILADAENDEYIISLLVDPNDFVDPTMDDLTVRVTIDGILGEGNYFEIGSIMWQKVVASSLDVDTGWTDVESSSLHLEFLDPPHVAPQLCSILPYLDSSGELILAIDTATYFLFTWDDSGTVGQGGIKERIFDQSSSGDNALTLWRPEIGVLVRGPPSALRFCSRNTPPASPIPLTFVARKVATTGSGASRLGERYRSTSRTSRRTTP